MNDQNNTPTGEQTIEPTLAPERQAPSLDVIKATFNKELTKHKYQEALDRFSALKITTENTASVQETLKKVRGFKTIIGNIKDAGKRPSLEEGRRWDKAYKDIIDPLELILQSKTNELQKILDKIAEENRKKELERQRIEGIKKQIDTYVLETSQAIAAAKTPEELVTIEKLIGSHKANKTRYQEFLPELQQRVEELTPLIKKQKEHIKELAEIEKKKQEAIKNEDDRTLEQLQEQQELVQHSIEESKIVVQETAIRLATQPDTTPAIPESQQIKYRRQTWRWEIEDILLLYKKAPHLVKLVPDDEKIDELLKTKKADGSLKDKDEEKVMGIRFYLERLA